MNTSSTAHDLINILLVLVLGTVAVTLVLRMLKSLFAAYAAQSALLAVIAIVLYWETHHGALIAIAVLTVASKVVLIPIVLTRIQRSMNIRRDLEFRYLSPITSLLLTSILVFLVYEASPRALRDLSADRQFYLSAVIGISMALAGMIVIFSRRKMITKIVGYLTMENGVLVFGMFVAELPFIIEVLIVIDLIMLIVLATTLAFGIDSSIDDFHKKLNLLGTDGWFKRHGKP